MSDSAEKLPDGRMRVSLSGRAYTVAAARASSAAFWAAAANGRWEDETFRFLDAVTAEPGAVLVDVGAWIGPVALYASPKVAKVIALEPDPVAHGELTANVAANAPNVEVWNAAIDNAPGELTLYVGDGLGNSETSSIGQGEAIKVKTVTFDQLSEAAGDGRAILKVDIEGHEYRVMEALVGFAKARRAPVHLSLHPRSFWKDIRKSAGFFGSRRATMDATWAFIEALSAVGDVVMSATQEPATREAIARKVLWKKRPKNFAVEVRAPR
ncbi:MAG TPA: FkbM family methyltransferase [Terricaulis sp.]|nr:FkbM family methyltransferase [Terricaulis sp.]